MGVLDIKGGVGKVGAQVVVELVAAGGEFSPVWDETELAKEGEVGGGMWGEAAAKKAGDQAADDRVASKRAGGGGVGGCGRELAGLLIRLDLATKRLRGEKRSVGRGGAAV